MRCNSQTFRLICLASLAAAVSLLATSLAHAEFRKAPNSRAALDLPADYVPSKQFAGFVNKTTGASIVVVDFPASAYVDLASIMKPDSTVLAQRGLTDVAAPTIDRSGEHFYLRARQMTPVPTANSKQLTVTCESVDSRRDGRSLQVDLVRCRRAVLVAVCLANRNPCPSAPAQCAAA
jgi:hypothetical protein